ncbi:TetR/AcrR family transcriptional regulator [Chloroflexi bacterium TSY]|nr:TetR/AcrR family transcriptional regulator [Chloroflexi bacterium TSY]
MTPTNSNRLSERERQILDATLELVATQGLLKTSISKISKQAQSSPGIVYHYFESKDEIMDTLFINIFSEMMTYILDDEVLERPVSERYKSLWLRKYRYHFNNPAKTVFIEQYKNSSYYTEEQEQESQRMMSGLMSMGQNDVDQGLVISLPLDVLYTMTFTVALNLAKSHIQADVRLEEDTLNTIAERVCGSVLA